MTLQINIHNDGTGDAETGNYDVEVLATRVVTESGNVVLERLSSFRVERHHRKWGWVQLLKEVADAAWAQEVTAVLVALESRRKK